jgi:outer membrane usher protein
LNWTSRKNRNTAAVLLIWALSPVVSAGAAGTAEVVEGWIPPYEARPEQNRGPIAGPRSAAASTEFKERLLMVDINRQQLNQSVLVLEDNAGALYLWIHDLRRWRVHEPDPAAAVAYQGEQYYPLSAISDVSHVYDPDAMTLMIEVRPGAFDKTALVTTSEKIPAAVKPGPGGFFNYDLFASNAEESRQRSGQFELGYFNRFGVGTTSLLGEELGSQSRFTRLDTSWTIDYPEPRQTLHLGDAINVPGSWGRSVRFGGIQFGTNFGTQPGFVSFPAQSVVGQAVLPSTVDVFVNNALVSRQDVPPGPFSISNLPVITGAGDVRLVVRDLLGREQIVTQPFYGSQSLLLEGLEQFSAEFGFVRENFGIESNDYGAWLGSGTYRRGLSEHLTGEVHGEALRDQATVGAGGDYLLPQFGTITAYLAGSRRKVTADSNASTGRTAIFGIDRQAQPWSFAARSQWTSRGFAQIGLSPPQLPPVRLSTLNVSYSGQGSGSVSASYVGQHNRDQADTRLATMSYSVSLGKFGSFMLSALRDLSGDRSTTIFAALNLPLSASTSFSLSSQSLRGGNNPKSDLFTTTLQRNLPAGEGYGYNVQARSDGGKEVSYSMQNNVGTYMVGAGQSQGSTETRLSVSGGLAMLDGDVFPSRRIDQSFAVVRIPDYPNVRILADNQPAGRTDADGNALIPRLRAYDRNLISIDQRDLPIDAEIDKLKLDVVPYFRSGIDVKVPIRRSRGATLTVHLEDGSALPVGAMVTIVNVVGNDAACVVGYGGQVYVVGLGATTRLRARWGSAACEFDVTLAPNAEPLPDLGTFTCIGVAP